MPRLQIGLLGTFQLARDGARGPEIESDKGRALLAYLALESAYSHRRKTLAALLWPESDDARANQNLRRALYNLRQALAEPADAPPVLIVSTQDVQFNSAADVRLDVLLFTGLLDQARAHAHARVDTCKSCHALLREAVELYRGDFLAGLALPDSETLEAWLLLRQEELRGRLMAALLDLAAYHERLREYEQAGRYLRRMIELEPWREEGHRRLMRVLALDGQRSAALQQYEILRRVLAEEMNLEPSAETTALAAEIRAEAVAVAAAEPPERLLAPTTPLLGRAAEMARITAALTTPGCRLLTLIGPPGIGKTRLAQEVANRLNGEYADGAYFIALAALSDHRLVMPAIAEALGISASRTLPASERISSHLHDKHLLLVLDNFEHLLEAAPRVAHLLGAAPHVQVLVTSRAALRLAGEHEFPVPPLALPGAALLAHPDPAALAPYAAVELFVTRARAIQPDFTLTPANSAAVAAICVRLDGLPLAIELAAARLRLFTPAALQERLTRRLQVLTGGPRDRDARQQTLRGAIAWSHDLLTPDEAILFRRLSIFVGGASLAAIEALCGEPVAGSVEPPDVLTAVESLLSQSLLQSQAGPMPNEPRFTMLETIREFAREQLAASGEEAALNLAHAHYYLAQVETIAPNLHGLARIMVLDRLEAEHDNLRAALAWSLAAQQPEIALRLGAALWQFWRGRRHWREARRLLLALLALAEATPGPLPTMALAGTHLGLACVSHDLTDNKTSAQHARISSAMFAAAARQEQGPRAMEALRQQAFALRALALALRDGGDNAASRPYLEQALLIQRELGDNVGVAHTIHNLGYAAQVAGEDEHAAALYNESLLLARQIDDPSGIYWNVLQLGGLQRRHGAYPQARRLLQESLDLAEKLGYPAGWQQSLEMLADTELALGDCAAARRLLDQAFHDYRELGAVGDMLHVQIGLAWVTDAEGDTEGARGAFRDALREAAAQTVQPELVIYCLIALASLLVREPQVEKQKAAARLYAALVASPQLLAETLLEPRYHAAYTGVERAIQATLSATELEQALREGRSMNIAAAVAAALL